MRVTGALITYGKIVYYIKACGCLLASAVFFLLLSSCGAPDSSPSQTVYTQAPAMETPRTETPKAAETPEVSAAPEVSVKAAPEFDGQAFCIAGTADIKDKPGYDGSTTGTIHSGAIADIIERLDGWHYIAYGGSKGYVKSEYFEELYPPDVPVPSGEWSLILVNPAHHLSKDFEVTLADFEGGQVGARILDICVQMFSDAEADGVSLELVDAYRSRERQSELYEKKVDSYTAKGYSRTDAEAKAATITARPDTSEHQTGLALDIVTPSYTKMNSGFANTKAYKWLSEHAHNYGFTLRYPKGKTQITKVIYEPWHWRFVGLEAAVSMKASGNCLEEYLGVID
ncbi:MAG: D-alanyl-D-alanine carboxypeptidase family protein [Burkholderiales bacterium]